MYRIRLFAAVLVCAAGLGVCAPAGAQTAAAGVREGEVASDPIRCWWKADRTALRVGERFGLVVTCAVIEAGEIVVVPNVNQLEPGALSITPFEVVSGARGDDVVAPPWRYLQFEYIVRLLSDGFFGQDVSIPALTVTYNLQTAGGTQGRDQSYELPTLPMRILSLVPRGATDIRDASGQTFETIGARRFRSSFAFVAAIISLVFAGVLAVFAVVLGVRGYRAKHVTTERALPAASVLGGCLRELGEIASSARGGWSPELAHRAIAVLRVAGAVALGRPVTQDVVGSDISADAGQVAVRAGWMQRQRVLLSAPITSTGIARHLDSGHAAASRQRVNLEPIGEAIGALTAASYGREWPADTSALDTAVGASQDAIRRLRARARWPMRTVAALRGLP